MVVFLHIGENNLRLICNSDNFGDLVAPSQPLDLVYV